MSTTTDRQIDELELKLNKLLQFCVEGVKDVCLDGSEANLSKQKEAPNIADASTIGNSDENFDGWLPISINGTRTFNFDLGQLKEIRDNARALMSNDIYKNIINQFRNHIIGDGLIYELTSKSLGEDPATEAEGKIDALITKMIENWEAFETKNNFNERLASSLEKAMRDGECPWRFFAKGKGEAPDIRFLEVQLIDGTNAGTKSPFATRYGVETDPQDIETIKSYYYNQNQDSDITQTVYKAPLVIPADKVIFIKRNTDFEFPRGISDFWPIIKNIRRIEKIVLNTSVLIQIQSAIALIRKHKGSTQPRLTKFVNSKGDGQNHRSVVTGKTVIAQNFRQGMIVDTNESIDYEMPSVGVKPEGFIAGMMQDLTKVATRFGLPLDWLIGKVPTDPLSPGDPTIMMFRYEQNWFYNYVEKAFWKVQELMGEDVIELKKKFELQIEGPRLAVGKVLDEARVVQILQQCAALSPQTIARRFGAKYAIERTNTIRHRKSLQPGEVAPGDLGNTEPGKNNGLDSKDKGTKADNAPGGDTRH